MRASQFLFATTRETPSDADIVSSQLMLRAGLIRKLASGLYSWLPMGLKVLQRVEAIVREEMNNAGALEIFMPMTQPAELWVESGRFEDYGPELLRFTDRHDRRFLLGPPVPPAGEPTLAAPSSRFRGPGAVRQSTVSCQPGGAGRRRLLRTGDACGARATGAAGIHGV